MPIYEWKCERCNGTITDIRSVADLHKPCECPKCSREAGHAVYAKPIISAPSGQFPGASGWQR